VKRKKEKKPHKVVAEWLADEAVSRGGDIYVGIDSGAHGAIAFICGTSYCVVDIPTVKLKRGKGQKTGFVYQDIIRIFQQLDGQWPVQNIHVCLEKMQIGFGKGNNAYAGFRMGCNYGMWPLFIVSKGYSLEEVTSTSWKKKMGMTSDKNKSLKKARKMFPKAPLTRKKDHDRAEALMIAEYLRREHKGQ
jgi:crossover junction endodeoxyribonuclease RuvC